MVSITCVHELYSLTPNARLSYRSLVRSILLSSLDRILFLFFFSAAVSQCSLNFISIRCPLWLHARLNFFMVSSIDSFGKQVTFIDMGNPFQTWRLTWKLVRVESKQEWMNAHESQNTDKNKIKNKVKASMLLAWTQELLQYWKYRYCWKSKLCLNDLYDTEFIKGIYIYMPNLRYKGRSIIYDMHILVLIPRELSLDESKSGLR